MDSDELERMTDDELFTFYEEGLGGHTMPADTRGTIMSRIGQLVVRVEE